MDNKVCKIVAIVGIVLACIVGEYNMSKIQDHVARLNKMSFRGLAVKPEEYTN